MSKTILVVEDYEDARQMLKFYLENCGYDVVEAADGYDAVKSVNEKFPALILMDLSLPHLDGLSATRQIKTIANADRIPVICLTAHGDYYKQEAIASGCVEVVGKPIDFQKLTAIIKRYLGEF